MKISLASLKNKGGQAPSPPPKKPSPLEVLSTTPPPSPPPLPKHPINITIKIWTDGSYGPETGHGGCGWAGKILDNRWGLVSTSLGKVNGSKEAEKHAYLDVLETAIDTIKRYPNKGRPKQGKRCFDVLIIATDAKWAKDDIIHILAGFRERGSELEREIESMARELGKLGVGFDFEWVPAHSGLPGNEMADKMAKRGRQRSEKSVEPKDEFLEVSDVEMVEVDLQLEGLSLRE